MQIIISAIGKLKKNTPEDELIQDYLKKTKWSVSIKEFEEKRALPVDQLKEAESNLLLSSVPAGGKIIALDEKGKTPSSREFALLLGKWIDEGTQSISFLIGGANGHADILKEKADYKLSFGRMTLPHMLARVVLAEQIYRAKTILDGHPYHKD
ncbi:MAG: 23S rRNA (pseudouridine(1915)-N(3))-methyltransferase RlmH [Alphaproteobacteria bacterium]|nr:23S rRNA (pseudouridine(1915)-N(3))-methyltransferase RlmH [Alphaproteobacteria bacterium]